MIITFIKYDYKFKIFLHNFIPRVYFFPLLFILFMSCFLLSVY